MTTKKPHRGDMSLEELRRVGADVIEAIAQYHAGLDQRRVLPAASPSEVAAHFADALPEVGISPDEILRDWVDRVAPLLTAVGSPRHFGFVNGSGSMIGILADALAACVNTNAGAWKLGPAASEIERQSLRWIADLIGYPTDCGGIVTTGGTMANFTALVTALRHVAPYDSTPDGLQDSKREGRFLVYMSDHEGHVSITRVVDMMNLGRNSIRKVPSHPDFTMDPRALSRMIQEDRTRGDFPLCVVAQLGSINVGAIDPIDEIAGICAEHGIWLHVDGACGLLAAMLPEMRDAVRGLERADSTSFDPHKWLGVPFDCGVVLIRDAEHLRRAFSITAPYLRGIQDDDHRVGMDFLEYGPEMSRGFRALKLWMTLRFYGTTGLRDSFAKSLELARQLHELVRSHPDFEVLHEPIIYLYCFRYRPRWLADRAGEPELRERLDQLNQEIAEAVQKSGLAIVMTSRIRGNVVLRMSICSQRTEPEDIQQTFDALAKAGRELSSLIEV
jgi:aromatic-L-amino-acid decarboxylase